MYQQTDYTRRRRRRPVSMGSWAIASPDRMALWAVLLAAVMIIIAIISS